MLARHVTEETIREAARATGVRADISRVTSTSVRFRLGLDISNLYEDGTRRYQRTSSSHFQKGRKVGAVCWHGHRDFFRKLFALAPEATVLTALAFYQGGPEDFEKQFPQTDQNVGSALYPMLASEACTCFDHNYN